MLPKYLVIDTAFMGAKKVIKRKNEAIAAKND